MAWLIFILNFQCQCAGTPFVTPQPTPYQTTPHPQEQPPHQQGDFTQRTLILFNARKLRNSHVCIIVLPKYIQQLLTCPLWLRLLRVSRWIGCLLFLHFCIFVRDLSSRFFEFYFFEFENIFAFVFEIEVRDLCSRFVVLCNPGVSFHADSESTPSQRRRRQSELEGLKPPQSRTERQKLRRIMEEQGIEDEEEVRPPLPPGMLPKSSVRRPKDPKDPKTSKKKDKNKKS